MSETFSNTIDIKYRLSAEQIESLLIKNYGNGKQSLIIGKEDDTIDRNIRKPIYFYDRSIEKEILDMVDILNVGYSKVGPNNFIEFNIDLIKKYKKRDYIPQCACLKIEGDYGWQLEIKRINKIRIHRTYNKKIIASLLLNDFTFIVQLNSKEKNTMYGYWGRPKYYFYRAKRQETDGISYWFNKNMLYNNCFRNFSVDLFNLVADKEKKYILKDVARSIRDYGFMLVPISYKLLSQLHKPSDINNLFNLDVDKLPINYNRLNINTGYIITKLSKYVDKDDVSILYNIDESKIVKMINLSALYDGMIKTDSIKNFFVKYYIDYYNYYNEQNRYAIGIIEDYVNMSLELNVPLKLKCSYKKMIQLHDELSIQHRKKGFSNLKVIKLVPDNSRFNILEKELLNLDYGIFRRIHYNYELFDEGTTQHNCVFTRKKYIYNDEVSIFHWDYLDNNFTIQFHCDYDGNYRIDEIRGKYNAECPYSIMDDLSGKISIINSNHKDELKKYSDRNVMDGFLDINRDEDADLPFM